MAKTDQVYVEGLSETVAALKELPKATEANVLRRVLLKAGKVIENDARAMAPRATGALQISISTVPASPSKMTRRGKAAYDKKSQVEVLVEAGPAPQAVLREFGTVNLPAHPYMRPAYLANKANVLDIIRTDIWDEIKKAAERLAKKTARLAAKQ